MAKEFCGSAKNNFRSRLRPSLPARLRRIWPPAYQYRKEDLRYLVVSTMEYPNLEYPDSNKTGAYATSAIGPRVGFRALYMKDQNMSYYEGEDGREGERNIKSQAQN